MVLQALANHAQCFMCCCNLVPRIGHSTHARARFKRAYKHNLMEDDAQEAGNLLSLDDALSSPVLASVSRL